MSEYTDEQAKAIASEHLEQGTFDFLDYLANRDMPTEDVEIFLDERTAHQIEKLTEDFINAKDGEQANLIVKQIEALREKAKASRFVVTIQGITNDVYDKIVDAAAEEFPYEYIETRHPLTMALQREVRPNEDRQTFFRVHYWAASIVKVSGARGVDENITPEWTAVLLQKAPLAALARIQVAIESLRMATDWMDRLATDDFLAKS